MTTVTVALLGVRGEFLGIAALWQIARSLERRHNLAPGEGASPESGNAV